MHFFPQGLYFNEMAYELYVINHSYYHEKLGDSIDVFKVSNLLSPKLKYKHTY